MCCESFTTKSGILRSSYKFIAANLHSKIELEIKSHSKHRNDLANYKSQKFIDNLNTSKSNVFNTISRCLLFFAWSTRRVLASAGVPSGNAVHSTMSPLQGASLWGTLFVLSAALHSAESAMTKLSPWKVLV